MKFKKLRSMLKSIKEETAAPRENLIALIQDAKEKNEDFLEYSLVYERQIKQSNEEPSKYKLRFSLVKNIN